MHDIEALEAALADAMEPTAKDAMEWAVRYQVLRKARYVTDDGDILTSHEYDRERAALSSLLKQYIARNGEFYVEGIGVLRISERTEDYYDVAAILRDPMAQTWAELGCFKVEKAKASVIDAKYRHQRATVQSRALVVDEDQANRRIR